MARRWLWAFGALIAPTALALAAQGCDNRVIVPDGDGGNGPGGEGTGLILTTSAGGGSQDGGLDALNEVGEDPCPDPPPPIQAFSCDPYDQNNGDCLDGEACYIYVEYPAEKCGQEIYGSICYLAGFGQQGDACNGAQECGAGLVCVVTGSGTQCVELCPLEGGSGCPAGYVCEPIDVEGFGGCL